MTPELNWKDHEDRIRRLLSIINAENSFELCHGLLFDDIVIFACQSIWHLKDWIVNDPSFEAKDINKLTEEIHQEECLLVCADIANRSKHYRLRYPKTSSSQLKYAGIHLEPGEVISKEYRWIISDNERGRYHQMEIRQFLEECWATWQKLIIKHYLSKVLN